MFLFSSCTAVTEFEEKVERQLPAIEFLFDEKLETSTEQMQQVKQQVIHAIWNKYLSNRYNNLLEFLSKFMKDEIVFEKTPSGTRHQHVFETIAMIKSHHCCNLATLNNLLNVRTKDPKISEKQYGCDNDLVKAYKEAIDLIKKVIIRVPQHISSTQFYRLQLYLIDCIQKQYVDNRWDKTPEGIRLKKWSSTVRDPEVCFERYQHARETIQYILKKELLNELEQYINDRILDNQTGPVSLSTASLNRTYEKLYTCVQLVRQNPRYIEKLNLPGAYRVPGFSP